MFLSLILILLPVVWLAVAAFAVAACRSASRADRLADGQKDRLPGGPPAVSRSETAVYGFITSQGV